MFASMYYQLWGSLVKIVGFVLQFVVLTIRSCQINLQYQRDVLLADFGKFGKSWRFADNYYDLKLQSTFFSNVATEPSLPWC